MKTYGTKRAPLLAQKGALLHNQVFSSVEVWLGNTYRQDGRQPSREPRGRSCTFKHHLAAAHRTTVTRHTSHLLSFLAVHQIDV